MGMVAFNCSRSRLTVFPHNVKFSTNSAQVASGQSQQLTLTRHTYLRCVERAVQTGSQQSATLRQPTQPSPWYLDALCSSLCSLPLARPRYTVQLIRRSGELCDQPVGGKVKDKIVSETQAVGRQIPVGQQGERTLHEGLRQEWTLSSGERPRGEHIPIDDNSNTIQSIVGNMANALNTELNPIVLKSRRQPPPTVIFLPGREI